MRPEIAIIMNDDWDTITGGISRFVREIAPRLAATFRVTVLSTRSTNGVVARTISSGLEVIRFPNYPSPPFFPDLKYPRFSSKISPYLERADLIFMQNADMPVTFLRARRARKPVVLYLHSLDWLRGHRYRFLGKGRVVAPFLRRYFSYWLNRADSLCLPSDSLKKTLLEAGITTPSILARAGIDTARFVPPVDKEAAKKRLDLNGKIIIGYTGRLWREKNLDFLVRVFDRIHERHPATRLLFVGDGPERYLRILRSHPGLIFSGLQDDVIPYLQAMDIFCHPLTSFETSSLATMEAMACGLPVIVNANGGPREYVEDGRNGYLIDPPDDETLFLDRLESLVKGADQRRVMGEAARCSMIKIGDWDRTTSSLQNLFEKSIEFARFQSPHGRNSRPFFME